MPQHIAFVFMRFFLPAPRSPPSISFFLLSHFVARCSSAALIAYADRTRDAHLSGQQRFGRAFLARVSRSENRVAVHCAADTHALLTAATTNRCVATNLVVTGEGVVTLNLTDVNVSRARA